MLSYFKSWIKKIRNYILYISFYEIFHKEKPKWLNDGLISSHFFGARNDEEFKLALNESRKILNHSLYNEWRLYSATMIVKMILDRKITKNEIFNYVECGVGIGMTLFIISKYIEKFERYKNFLKKNSNFLLMDTFEGVDLNYIPNNLKNHNFKTEAYNGATEEVITKRFDHINNVKIIKGSIPETLSLIDDKYYTPDFLHIDMNNPLPEQRALEFFYPKMKSGSVILLDDYSFVGKSYNQQREVINQYCDKSKISRPLTLPTGQGILIKF